MMNNETALKGQQAIAQGNALWLNATTNLIAPHSVVAQGDKFAWGKINDENKENVECRITKY